MDILGFLKRKGMTQSALSKALDTSGANVNKWVNGNGYPSYEICRKLLELGITVEELFGVEYKQYPKELFDIADRDPTEEERRFQAGVEKALKDLLSRANNGQQ